MSRPLGLQERLVAPLRDELGRHVLAEDVASDADGALRVLANAGRTLLRALFDRVRNGPAATGAASDQRRVRQVMRGLAAASDQTLQIVRADAQQAIPWGLVYDWGLPARSGPVCWGVIDNGATKPAPCVHTAKDKVVCVRGFWGVRHRIEELVDVGRDIDTSLPQAPAVDLAMGVDNSFTRRLRDDLARLVTLSELGPADVLLDRLWQDATRPNVLAVVGHFDEALRAIECGTSERHLSAEMITDRAFDEGDWRDPAPIVLLLACESGAVTPTDVTSHLLALMAVGAAAIVATECVVKTSHVQAFTAEFLGALLTSDPSPPGMAAALQRVRTALLADQRLLPVLAFTAFGSADLRAVAS